MKAKTILSLLATAGAFCSSIAYADTNVALGKPVTLIGSFATGSGYFGGGNGGYELPSPTIVTDGIFQGGYWATGIWWDEQNSGTHNYVVVDLLNQYTLTALAVAVDNNDQYLLEYRNSQGEWSAAWQIPELSGGGLMQRSTTLATPISANALRVSAVHDYTPGHDYAYSVSEIQATAVPEPASWLMLAASLPALLLSTRRRSVRRG